jgi:hypothetical protein
LARRSRDAKWTPKNFEEFRTDRSHA